MLEKWLGLLQKELQKASFLQVKLKCVNNWLR